MAFIAYVFWVLMFTVSIRDTDMLGRDIPDGLRFAADRFPAVVGLPCAALFSLFLVTFLRQAAGPIEIKMAGMEFKGPSGQVIMWLICFLGIALAIKLLW